MRFVRRLPGVRTAVRHTHAIEASLATLDARTAELGPGVLNTLLYDSASSLEAMDHIVATLHVQERQIATLIDELRASAEQHRSLMAHLEMRSVEDAGLVPAALDRLAGVVEPIGRTADRSLQQIERLTGAIASLPEDLFERFRTDVEGEFDARVDRLLKELGRIEETIAELALAGPTELIDGVERLEARFVGDLNSGLLRTEDRILRDLDQIRIVLSGELSARTSALSAELGRTELSLRDSLTSSAAREADRLHERLRSNAEAAELVRTELATAARTFADAREDTDGHALALDGLQQSVEAVMHELTAVLRPLGDRLADDERSFDSLRAAVRDLPVGGRVAPLADPIEPEVELASALTPYLRADTALDIGAHRGAWSVALAHQGLRVTAVEPSMSVIGELRRRVAGQSRVAVVEAAAAQHTSEAVLYQAHDDSPGRLHGEMSLRSTLHEHVAFGDVRFTPDRVVATMSIATIVHDQRWDERVGLISIDTEGTESEVLHGLGNVRAEVIAISFRGRDHPLNQSPGVSAVSLVEQMIGLGYRRWIAFIRNDRELHARVNARTFPDECWGRLVFFNDVATFVRAQAWCEANLVAGCR